MKNFNYPPLRVFGHSDGKFRISISIKNYDCVYHRTHFIRLRSRSEVAHFLRRLHRAYLSVKHMKSSKAFTAFKMYSLRWVVYHAFFVTIFDDNDNVKVFSFHSAAIQWILDDLG